MSTTVAGLMRALGTYPGHAEVWMDYDPHSGALMMHIHPPTPELECFPMWDGMGEPENYHPIIEVMEER